MKRIIFESAPEFVILCVVVALAYAVIQYYRTAKQPWSNAMNWALLAMRFTLTFFLCFLLLGPVVKQIRNLFEKPHFIFLYDNSASVKAASDTSVLKSL